MTSTLSSQHQDILLSFSDLIYEMRLGFISCDLSGFCEAQLGCWVDSGFLTHGVYNVLFRYVGGYNVVGKSSSSQLRLPGFGFGLHELHERGQAV